METPPWCTFLVQVYSGLKSCPSLLENVSLRVPANNLRDFQLFGFCSSNKNCPSARCTYAANAAGKDLDIFALRAVSLNHILLNLKFLIFVHTPNVLWFFFDFMLFAYNVITCIYTGLSVIARLGTYII
jgi:hypothetical protein